MSAEDRPFVCQWRAEGVNDLGLDTEAVIDVQTGTGHGWSQQTADLHAMLQASETAGRLAFLCGGARAIAGDRVLVLHGFLRSSSDLV